MDQDRHYYEAAAAYVVHQYEHQDEHALHKPLHEHSWEAPGHYVLCNAEGFLALYGLTTMSIVADDEVGYSKALQAAMAGFKGYDFAGFIAAWAGADKFKNIAVIRSGEGDTVVKLARNEG